MSKERYSGLRFPAHKYQKDLHLIKEFAPLFRHEEFKACPVKDKIVRYICFLYDSNSELNQEFPKLEDRKEAAAMEAGYSRTKTGEWPEEVNKLFALTMGGRDKNDEVVWSLVHMIFRFLKVCNDRLWMEIVVTEQELDNYTRQRLDVLNIDMKAKTAVDILVQSGKLQELSSSALMRLEGYKKQFYLDHGDVREAVEELEMITPENAERIMKVA